MFLYVDPDAEVDGPVETGENKGKLLKRLYRPMHVKFPVANRKGKTKLEPALVAAKFARERSNALRNHVPVRSRWNKYERYTGSKSLLKKDCFGKPGPSAAPKLIPLRSMHHDEWKMLLEHCGDSQPKVSSITMSAGCFYFDNTDYVLQYVHIQFSAPFP